MSTRRSAQRDPTPEHHVTMSSGSRYVGKLVHIDHRAAHDPRHLGESGVASVVVGQVLQIAGGGIEPQSAARRAITEPNPPRTGERPARPRAAPTISNMV